MKHSSRPAARRTAALLLVFLLVAVGAASVTLLALGRSATGTPPAAFHGLPFNPPEPAPDFTLLDQNRHPLRLSDLQGSVVVLYFGFTYCPDECPATLGKWKSVYEKLGAEAGHVRFVMITVDPERDTPERMGEYLSAFSPAFVGLSGPLADIEDTAQAYNVFFKKVGLTEEQVESLHLGDDEHTHEEEVYLVNHTTLTYVIDPTGQLVLAHTIDMPVAELLADLAKLLQ